MERDRSVDIGSRLMVYFVRGEELDLAGEESVDETAMRSWGESRTVHAELIRDILREPPGSPPDPHGLRLRGARIEGRLDLENIETKVGLALRHCFLTNGLNAVDASLPALTLEGCVLEHPSDPPLAGDRLHASAVISLTRAIIKAHTKEGAVRLTGARINGSLSCTATKIYNTAGPALDAERLQAEQNVYLRDGLKAYGAGPRGAVRISGARIGGQLDCTNAEILNPSGPALVADSLQVDQTVFLSAGLEIVGNGTQPVVSLSRARIGGQFEFSPDLLMNLVHPTARLAVDGLVYGGVPIGSSIEQWLTWLGEGAYAAQPYQQLAATNRSAGHDSDVRKILIAQRRHQLISKTLTKPASLWARFTGVTLGFGYQPWRALLALAGVLIIALCLCLFMDGALAHTKSSGAASPACTTLERIGVGVDMGLPLIKTGAQAKCEPTSAPAGERLTALGWVLQLVAWAFATLFIAGFTGAVRKT